MWKPKNVLTYPFSFVDFSSSSLLSFVDCRDSLLLRLFPLHWQAPQIRSHLPKVGDCSLPLLARRLHRHRPLLSFSLPQRGQSKRKFVRLGRPELLFLANPLSLSLLFIFHLLVLLHLVLGNGLVVSGLKRRLIWFGRGRSWFDRAEKGETVDCNWNQLHIERSVNLPSTSRPCLSPSSVLTCL